MSQPARSDAAAQARARAMAVRVAVEALEGWADRARREHQEREREERRRQEREHHDPAHRESPRDAVRRLGPRPELAGALANTCRWLRRESYQDARDIRTWSGAGPGGGARLSGANARQAWCYGTPGVAWALWDAAEVLGDGETGVWAAEAFTSLADGYHEGFHLFGEHPGDRLGLCHGAAGVLAVADAFHRHAALPAATALRSRMLHHLLAAEDELRALGRERAGLLTGVGGALAAVLTATGGSGTWLPCLGLR
ncbi:hypothetical protein OIE63_30630 [Streptomyces sp. NBC_01795]|uniref:lanthionine synthetase LanC family protein n=1 Tax=Streptomyces sp. NBC_01795 TaxID=2975943 RepID=UPI002DD9B18D|nr:lanthionine synthetase LanC family protein [Streptomyces sp. NBC_01795]WSA95431.1 hypothetical protein OIE63_30630 [Streptomyces sp. NBC_01795]